MAKALKIEPRTKAFIAAIDALKKRGRIKSNAELVQVLGINNVSTISEIKAERQNIQPDSWEKFKIYFQLNNPNKSVLKGTNIGEWIFSDESYMLGGNEPMGEEPVTEYDPKKRLIMAPKGKFGKKTPGGRINFYDTDFAAGDVDFYDDNNTITPAYEMDIPEFAGCTAFRTYGDSMEPMVKSGSILFGTKLDDWQSHLEYGQIYGIVCKDKRKYLKYIRKDKDNPVTHYLLRSENIEYDEFELPKNKIKHIWLIHGWINKRN